MEKQREKNYFERACSGAFTYVVMNLDMAVHSPYTITAEYGKRADTKLEKKRHDEA